MNVTKVSFYKEKIFSARWFQTWGTLLLGSMVIATGYTFFMTPYQIVPGRNLWYFYHFELETGIPDRYGGIVF